jgi:tRNA(Met) cytidine acetyltransferase
MTRPPRRLWRNFRIISGEAVHCRQQAQSLLQGQAALWIGNGAPDGFQAVPPDRIAEYLGQDVEHLVFDALQDLDPDALAIASGLVCGGGHFLLLVPELSRWGRQPQSLFLQRMAGMCKQQEPGTAPAAAESAGEFTGEQEQLIQALHKVARGHRKRPLVVIADRGRGKSSAFGMGAARLLGGGLEQILVTAPRRGATRTLFEHAARELGTVGQERGRLHMGNASIRFIAPDELLEQLPAAQLLLVDEAAGIPLPMLERMLQHYHRIAFATTVHGYEGSGRGFSLRFSRILNEHCAQWKQLTLREPVRWARGDPLEAFIFQTLLLNAEPARIESPVSNLEIGPVARKKLLQEPVLLEQLFGLLVDAHYRTTPTDLKHLLDAPDLTIHCARRNGDIIAAMLVAAEGHIPAAQHKEILAGRRRPRGQLLPAVLASHCGFPQALSLGWERVLRIAVHPDLQGQGIGSRMLEYLAASARERGVDMLGSSFGATPALLDFWQRNGYAAVRLGQRREASSSAHAVTMLHGLSHVAKDLQTRAEKTFQEHFPLQLSEPFRNLSPPLVRRLLPGRDRHLIQQQHRQTLAAFAAGQRQYLDALGALHQLARTAPADPLLVLKILQHRSWPETAAALGLTGRKAVLKKLRNHVADWLQNHPEVQAGSGRDSAFDFPQSQDPPMGV